MSDPAESAEHNPAWGKGHAALPRGLIIEYAEVAIPTFTQVLAWIDGNWNPAPAHIQGLHSALRWLERDHPDAVCAAFFEAVKTGDHPTLISGGTYAPGFLCAFVTHRSAS